MQVIADIDNYDDSSTSFTPVLSYTGNAITASRPLKGSGPIVSGQNTDTTHTTGHDETEHVPLSLHTTGSGTPGSLQYICCTTHTHIHTHQ